MSRLSIQRSRLDPVVDCEGCDRLHPQATRERARQHAHTQGHTVRYVIADVTIYRPEPDRPPAVVTVDTGELL